MDWNQMHVFTVHMDRHGAFVRHHRQRCSRSSHARSVVGTGRWMSQPPAQFVTRKDGHTHLREVLVAAGVIAMHMSVHHEPDRLVGNLMDGRGNLLRQGRELRIHHEGSVRSYEHSDGAPLAFERVEAVGHLSGLDFHFAEIGLRSLGVNGGGEHRE